MKITNVSTFFLLFLVEWKGVSGVLCPTSHHRCTCQTEGDGRKKAQSLICTGVWSLPPLNDSIPAATADWKLFLQDSNDLGLIPLYAFSGLRRHKVHLRKNLRLSKIENHSFKDARIDHLKISGYHTNTIGLIESEAFNQLEGLSRNVRDCDWEGDKSELKCSTSIHLSNIASFEVTERTFGSFKSLQDIYLNVEKLQIRAGALKELKDLQQLRIMGCYFFTPIKSIFEGLSSLRVLKMVGIGLNKISRDLFDHMPKLEVVDLSKNQIQTLDIMSFSKLVHLTHLSLERNQIEDRTDTPVINEDFPKLKVLRMNDNQLTTLPVWLQAQRDIEEIHFGGNTILCDCRLYWLHKWGALKKIGWDNMFTDLVATCSSENWLTCSKVCPFDCRLEDCVSGLKTKKCKTKTIIGDESSPRTRGAEGLEGEIPHTKLSACHNPFCVFVIWLFFIVLCGQ